MRGGPTFPTVSRPVDLPQKFPTAEAALRARWGYDGFRGLQAEVIEHVLRGRDALALMPTGGGKSLCFQVPALVRPGVCVVISPLIALMKDQVAALRARGVRAAALYSGLSRREQEAVYDRAQFGGLDLLYLSPERLLSEWARIRLERTDINLLAVDEAHCISQWGHEFRPAYRQIAEVRSLMPETPVLALTATATPRVADDICGQLEFGLNAQRFTMSFARPNLTYAIREVEDKQTKLVEALRRVPGSAVVYTRSRGRAYEVAGELERRGISAAHYHAGLPLSERDEAQSAWLEGRKRVVVATNAFGMGIDKPDVRLVAHLDLPDSLEAYFQEAGRAGRDGERSYGLLLYRAADAERLARQLAESTPAPELLRRVYHALGNYCNLAIGAGEGASYDFNLAAFAKTYDLPAVEVAHALDVLQAEGIVYTTDAVFRPAMICMLASREELYDYALRNPSLSKLVQAILRTHHGAHQQLVYLKEAALSKQLGVGVHDLRKQLDSLKRQQIIDYRPQGELPQLTWTVPRMHRESLSIDWKNLRKRHDVKTQRVEAAIAYAKTQECRQIQLLGYFGETAPACGQCDVCRAREQAARVDLARYLPKVSAVLRRQALTPAELLDAFAARHHPSVLAASEQLLTEGVIEEAQGRLRLRENPSLSA